MEPQSNNTNNNKIFIYAVGLTLFFFILIGIMIYGYKTHTERSEDAASNKNQLITKVQPSPTLIPHPTKGSMYIVSSSGSTRLSQENEIKLLIKATSSNQDITGFDLVVSYDTKAFDFIKATPLLGSFKAYPFQRKNYLAVTVTKTLTDTSKTVFDNTSLLEITLQPKKTGKYSFSLKPIGNDSTKFIDIETETTYPETKELSLEIY